MDLMASKPCTSKLKEAQSYSNMWRATKFDPHKTNSQKRILNGPRCKWAVWSHCFMMSTETMLHVMTTNQRDGRKVSNMTPFSLCSSQTVSSWAHAGNKKWWYSHIAWKIMLKVCVMQEISNRATHGTESIWNAPFDAVPQATRYCSFFKQQHQWIEGGGGHPWNDNCSWTLTCSSSS